MRVIGENMENETKNIDDKLAKLVRDVELIKNILMSEGELSDWARNELDEARRRKTKISHSEVKKKILEI